jgi:transposase
MDTNVREALEAKAVLGGDLVKREGPRRRRTIAEKRRIVEETLRPGASVARVARAHEVNANQVFHWRRLFRRGRLGGGSGEARKLLPVQVTEALVSSRLRSAGERTTSLGRIEVESRKGVLRLEGRVDGDALRLVLEQLLG